jgi:hypothetical protein
VDIQLDGYSHLPVFILCAKQEDILEEFVSCEQLQLITKETGAFNLVTDFFSKHKITLDVCGAFCTDGAPAI